MLALWAFAKSPWGKAIGVVLGVALVLLFVNRVGYASGVRAERAKDQKAQAAAAAQVAQQAAAQVKRADELRAQLNTALADNSTRTQTLIQKVPYYVTRKADAACTVNRGFVQLWNGGAGGPGAAAQAPGGPVEAPSGVALSEVARADAANYGVAYDWRAEALTWRAWGADLVAHWYDKR